MKIDAKWIAALLVMGFLVYVAYGDQILAFIGQNPVIPTEQPRVNDENVEYSTFKFTAVKKDATGTTVTGATVRAWFDWDNDGKLDWDTEIGTFTESSGVYTSDIEYPISDPVNGQVYTIWVQAYATGYQITYKDFIITGSRNSDGSAKPVGQMELVATDDSFTYDGLIKNIAWDDSTDYNYTLNGATGTAKIICKGGSTTSKGLTSQVWEQVDYMSIYDIHKDHAYYIKWDTVSKGMSKDDIQLYAATFLGLYMTNQDKVDLGIKAGDFDFSYHGVSNYYFAAAESIDFSQLFYYSTDDSSVEYEYSFQVDISAAGAIIKVGFLQDVKYEDFEEASSWPVTTAANVIGTLGADWDWVA